jgi:hypothetical protein
MVLVLGVGKDGIFSQENEGPFPSFLDPLGVADAKRQVWGCSFSVEKGLQAARQRFGLVVVQHVAGR